MDLATDAADRRASEVVEVIQQLGSDRTALVWRHSLQTECQVHQERGEASTVSKRCVQHREGAGGPRGVEFLTLEVHVKVRRGKTESCRKVKGSVKVEYAWVETGLL